MNISKLKIYYTVCAYYDCTRKVSKRVEYYLNWGGGLTSEPKIFSILLSVSQPTLGSEIKKDNGTITQPLNQNDKVSYLTKLHIKFCDI